MSGSVRSSFALLVRHQRLVWWMFAVNLVLAWLSSLPARASLSAALDHSLEGLNFINGFDLVSFMMLTQRPSFPMGALASAGVACAVVFFVYAIFLDGGIFAVYLHDRKLDRGEFFDNCGLYLWRMVRLAIYSLPALGVALAINGAIGGWADNLSEDAPSARTGFFVSLAGHALFLLLFLFVRLWFDLTQAQVVQHNERRLLRTVARTFLLALRSGGLYLRYVGILLLTMLLAAALGAAWYKLPHRAAFFSFLVLELVTLLTISCRLWMKASSARLVALLPVPIETAVVMHHEFQPVAEEAPAAPATEAPSGDAAPVEVLPVEAAPAEAAPAVEPPPVEEPPKSE